MNFPGTEIRIERVYLAVSTQLLSLKVNLWIEAHQETDFSMHRLFDMLDLMNKMLFEISENIENGLD